MRNSKFILVLIGMVSLAVDFCRVKHIGTRNVASNALIKMSSVGITAVSGKAGGSVFSRNRGGEYFKNFVMPTNTITAARQAVRAIFGSLSSAWRTLTQTQRNSWIEQAPNYLRTNVFGDQKQLQPNALFVGQNTNLLNAGLDLIETIPAPEGANGIVASDGSLFDLAGGTPAWDFQFDLEATNSEAGENHYVLEAAPPHGQSKKNVQNQYRVLAKTTDISATAPQDELINQSDFFTDAPTAASDYIAQFGAPLEGDEISFRIKAINPATGEVSSYWYENTIVQDL